MFKGGNFFETQRNVLASRSNIHHRPALLWRFRDSGTVYKTADLLTYLCTVHGIPAHSRLAPNQHATSFPRNIIGPRLNDMPHRQYGSQCMLDDSKLVCNSTITITESVISTQHTPEIVCRSRLRHDTHRQLREEKEGKGKSESVSITQYRTYHVL